MDARRLLSLAAAGLLLSGCATLRGLTRTAPAPAAAAPAQPAAREVVPAAAPAPRAFAAMAPIPDPAQPASAARAPAGGRGPAAIAAANAEARAPSEADRFVGGLQVFRYAAGRIYEVWTTPLRVTTLTLGPGEALVAKAAGDTIRWQIGDTTSGAGGGQRAHVMIKPLEAGLETNLVLTTSRRVYLLQLRSGAPQAFNAAVAWDTEALDGPAGFESAEARIPDPVVTPQGALDARFRIEARGRRPRWSPASVMTDGVRTFIVLAPEAAAGETPALFALAPDGAAQMVNYRQEGGLLVVDRVLDRAELRLGGRRPQVVRITHLTGDRS